MDPLTLAYVLIGLGAILLLAELLITTGVLFLLGILSALAGVALTFIHGETSTGFITLIAVFLGLPLLGSVLFWLYPKSPLASQTLAPEEDMTVADMPGNLELSKLKGKIGRTVSPMRPSGTVEFDGRRIDCITEGIMLEADRTVKCVDVRAGRVVVREVESPKMREFGDAEFG